MNHSHHEYLFDYRYKDLETGKLNIDKLTTLNGNTCLSDWIEPGKEPSYEYCVLREQQHQKADDLRVYVTREQRSLYEVKELEKTNERIRQKALEEKRIREIEKESAIREAKRQETIRELEEYRVRLQIREEQLIKEKQRNLAERMGYSGQRIITSKWNVR